MLQTPQEDSLPSYETVIAKPTLYCLFPASTPSSDDVTTSEATTTAGQASGRLFTESRNTERGKVALMQVPASHSDDALPSYESVRHTWPGENIPLVHQHTPADHVPIATPSTSFVPSLSHFTSTHASLSLYIGSPTPMSNAPQPS